jgi:transcriptional regulator
MMLIRPHDASRDETEWRQFVTAQGFGHLCVRGVGDVPVVVPTQFVLGQDEIVFHLAKANPVFEALDATPRAVMSVAGDWAYIPGAWKMIGDEDPSLGVPTTYYGAVQISGAVQVSDDIDAIAATLRTQLADVEPDGGLQDPLVHTKRFKAIRGVRLAIEEVRAKFKYGGNADAEHRAAIAERLRTRNGPGDLAAADRVRLD